MCSSAEMMIGFIFFKFQTSQHVALNGSSIFSEISVLENESDFSLKLTASPSSKVRDYWQLKVKLNYACKFYF